MTTAKLKIREGGHGLHARPASQFVRLASSFPCEVKVIRDEIEANGKSILGLMMLALSSGVEFTILTEGEREEEAIQALVGLVESDFKL
jgi:phosphocarrier protein